MSLKSFENYERIAAAEGVDDTEVAGRYQFQADAERRIVDDVASKLQLGPDDALLEIGCGPGNLLLPLGARVHECFGIDNAAALERLRRRAQPGTRVTTIAGDFLSVVLPPRRFSKVLVYSVMQCLDDAAAAVFLERALSLVEPGGRLLVGDLANQDKKRRYAASAAGQAGSAAWRQQVEHAGPHPLDLQPRDEQLLHIDDALVLGWLALGRARGFESYLLAQSPDLPFGNTREDLLFVAGE